MNSKQKKVVIVAVCIIILMALFPPWLETVKGGGKVLIRSIGYGFLFYPPDTTSWSFGASIDFTRLFLQWFVVALIGGGWCFMVKDQ